MLLLFVTSCVFNERFRHEFPLIILSAIQIYAFTFFVLNVFLCFCLSSVSSVYFRFVFLFDGS